MNKDNVHKHRRICLEALYDIGGEGNLYEIHNETKKKVENGVKIHLIYYSLTSLESIVTVEESETVEPDINARIVKPDQVKTLLH